MDFCADDESLLTQAEENKKKYKQKDSVGLSVFDSPLLKVSTMDEQREDIQQETPEESGYTPRPMWQVWLARIGLVLFILLVIMYYINIARGGI